MPRKKALSTGLAAAAGIVKAVPVYPDAIQPAAKEVGKGLATVARSINVALAPLSAMVWGYDRIKAWLEAELANRLAKVPPRHIITPDPHVVGPAVESLRFANGSEDLRNMFATLIATSMDARVASRAHPTFVEILKQISADEARIMCLFLNNTYSPIISIRYKEGEETRDIMRHLSDVCDDARCDLPSYTPAYLGNLQRLGLLEFSYAGAVEDRYYKRILVRVAVKEMLAKYRKRNPGIKFVYDKGYVSRTMLGQMFLEACVGETSGVQAKMAP